MTEFLRNNQTALRTCVLYEFVEGKPVFESYKNMCKRIGENAINYGDFKFWFMRFANGNFDLNYDRSLEPKTLSDMPIHIFEKIVNKLELMDRFVIRKLSKNYQYIIDSWNPGFKTIRIEIGKNRTFLHFDEKLVEYKTLHKRYLSHGTWKSTTWGTGGCLVQFGIDGKRKSIIKDEKDSNLALDDLAIVLNNPKLQLDELEVDYSIDECFEKFESMLKSLNRKVHVKKVTIKTNSPHSEMTILPHMKTGTLKEIVIRATNREVGLDEMKIRLDRIGELEQYQHADMLTFMSDVLTESFPIESFLEFRRFTIDYNFRDRLNTLFRFTQALLTSTVLELAILKTWAIPFVSDFWEQLGPRAIEVPDRPNTRRIPISNSDEFFEIEVDDKSIRIERTC